MPELVKRMDEYDFLREFQTSECYKDRFSRENIFAIYDYIEEEDIVDSEYTVFCLVDIAERFRQDTIEDFLRYQLNSEYCKVEEIQDIFEKYADYENQCFEDTDGFLTKILDLDYEILVEKISSLQNVINVDKEGNVLYFN